MWLQAVQQQSVAVRSARVRYAAVCAQKDAAEVARARATAASMSGWSVGEVAVLMSHLGVIRHAYEHTEHTVVLVMQVTSPRCGLSRAMQHMHMRAARHVRWTGRRSDPTCGLLFVLQDDVSFDCCADWKSSLDDVLAHLPGQWGMLQVKLRAARC